MLSFLTDKQKKPKKQHTKRNQTNEVTGRKIVFSKMNRTDPPPPHSHTCTHQERK